MNRILIFLLLIIIPLSSFAQQIPTAPNLRNAEDKRVGDWVITYSKSWKETALKDSIAFYRVIKFDDAAKPVGKTTDYYLNGKKQWEGSLLEMEPEGIMDGLCISYHENGQKKNEVNYYKNQVDGHVNEWYENGRPEVAYEVKNNKIEGVVKKWDKNNLQSNHFFENGEYLNLEKLIENISLLSQNSKYLEALQLGEKLKKITEQTHGKESIDFATSLTILARIYEDQSSLDKSEKYYLEALDIIKNPQTKEKNEYLHSLNNLGNFYKKNGEYIKAETLYLKALPHLIKIHGEHHLDYASALDYLADLYTLQGIHSKAETFYQKEFAVIKFVGGEQSLIQANFLNKFARFYHNQGVYTKAEKYYIEALNILIYLNEVQTGDYGIFLNNLGQLYLDKGDNLNAKNYFIKALPIIKSNFGLKSVYARIISNIACLDLENGDYIKAESSLKLALAIIKDDSGTQNEHYLKIINNLGVCYLHQTKHQEAFEIFTEAIKIYQMINDELSPQYYQTLNNLSTILGNSNYKILGKNETLINFYTTSLEVFKKHLGVTHPNYLSCLINLAETYCVMGKYIEAEGIYREEIDNFKNVIGIKHPYYTIILNNLAILYFRTVDYLKAGSLFLESYYINKNRLSAYFLASTEKERKLFWSSHQNDFHFGSNIVSKNSKMIPWYYNYELNFKGLQLESKLNFKKYIVNSNDTELIKIYDNYVNLQKELIKQLINPIKGMVNLGDLEAQVQGLENQLVQKSEKFQKFQKYTQMEYSEVKKITKAQIAIEFSSFEVFDGYKWTDTTYYTAILLRPEWKEPKMVRLFEKRQLDKLLGKNIPRETLANSLYRGGGKIPDVSVKSSQELYKLVWQPLDSLLQGVKTIYYSPSGLLHQLNLSAIPVNDSLTLGEKYNMYRIGSTRQLAEENNFTTVSDHSLLMGNINFDADSVSITAANKTIKLKVNIEEKTRGDESNRGDKWVPLINTGPEISSIAKYSTKADTLTYNYATEEAFYTALSKKPKVIHLATHGFFYDAPKDTISVKRNEPVFVNAQDAMLRSGLVLAGANRVWTGGTPIEGQEDGILTAYEVSLTDMRNTELVVTSACETALGDVNSSEGVFGLQRAFKIAGAKNLLMSLWKVSDEATKDYMETFYRLYLKESKSIHDAYQLTQSQMKKKYKDPYYWAAFILLE